MTEYSFFVQGIPRPQPRPRLSRTGHVYNPKSAEAWKNSVIGAFLKQKGKIEKLTGPVAVEVEFCLPIAKSNSAIGRPDLDNLLVSIHAPAWSATSVGKFPADKKYRLKPTKNREETAKADAEKRKASDREDSGAFRFLSDAAGIDAKVLRLILLVIPAMFIDLLMPICFYWGFKDARS